MLDLLTQYLTRARSVTIPHLGSLTLEASPATWSVADRELAGPGFRVHAGEERPVDDRQIAFLAGALRESESILTEKLSDFGSRLHRHLLREPFLWPGVGLLHWQDGRLALQPATPVLLAPQPAARVIHADARHSIRVGEQEVWSDAEQAPETKTRRNELEWLAWLLVVLAVLFILWCFYRQHFSVHATGLQTGL
ncbi:hypothetical protein EPD60_00560 [Flaviaesturariibacter flavus]|uniref:CCDC81-like prokaryotic HU domain-containing protein n=1 Tax=Flaviaesturariibacter flavus TaxID=2502780 RepID=A0A4R1BQS6_9BACT|nr:hypothetical protein [Flaviaesturariibacter flavus]TCJ19647.1 hypothetical protein EPD60_00560 [Flaviaesturariibacter flavus]